MGAEQSVGAKNYEYNQSSFRKPTPEELSKLNQFPAGLDLPRGELSPVSLCGFRIVTEDEDWKEAQDFIFNKSKGGALSPEEEELDRALGVIFGMVIGDALGAPLEFSALDYNPTVLVKSFEDEEIWTTKGFNRFMLDPGQWTDDASMGLCLVDSFLENEQFNPLDLRLRFLNWWTMGYNNAFPENEPRQSCGLGGNISMSMSEFKVKRNAYTEKGNRQTSGNGSLMRNAATPVMFFTNLELGLSIAWKQSKTTHQGDEAAEACRLLTYICARCIKEKKGKEILEEVSQGAFESELYSVSCLAKSKQEERVEENNGLNLKDRNWCWKADEWKYAESRAFQQPGYMGSYSMDGLCMALHCVWTTDSFESAVLKAINLRGDADTVGAICGQLAGAIYGVSSIPNAFISCIQKFDGGGSIAARGLKLFKKAKGVKDEEK